MKRPSAVRTFARSAALLGALIAGAASCGSPKGPDVAQVEIPARPKTTSDPAEERCEARVKRVVKFVEARRADMIANAPGLLAGASRERFTREWPPWCARALVEKTRAECGDALLDHAAALDEVLRDYEDRRKAARFEVSSDGKWIVEWAGVHHVVRVWEALPDGPRLAWLLGPAEGCAPVEGAPAGRIVCHVTFEDRLGGDARKYLLVLDAAANTVQRLDDVEGWQRQGDLLVLASSRRIRRLDWATLAVTADLPKPNVDYAFAFAPELLAGGQTVLLGDTLVSLKSGAVLAHEIEPMGYSATMTISADRRRLLPCAGGSPVLLDAATGKKLPITGRGCDIGMAFTDEVGRAVGAHETVGQSRGSGVSDRVLTPFVVDLATGAARSVPAATFRVARRGQWSRVYLPDGGRGRVCLSYAADAGKGVLYYGEDNETDVCPWQLDAAGALSKKAPPPDPLSAATLHLTGTGVARATSPDGGLVLVATVTARPQASGDPAWEIRVAEVNAASKKVQRVLTITRTELALSWADPPRLFVGGAFPSGMGFIGPSHAVLATSPPQVVDLAAGTIATVQGEHLGARWALTPEHDALIDLVTMKRSSLDPDQAAWRAVKTWGRDCPERLEDDKP